MEGANGRCFLAAWAVSTSAIAIKHADQNQTWQNGRVFTYSDIQRGPAYWQRPFQDGKISGKNSFFREHCQQVSKAHYSPAEHRRPH